MHLYCTTSLCGEFIDDIYANDPLAANIWYTIQIQIMDGSIKVTAYPGNDITEAGALFTIQRPLNLSQQFSEIEMFTRFGINNNYDEVAYWDDFNIWWDQMPTVFTAPKDFSDGWYPGVRQLQGGAGGYYGLQDTYIVTTNWESPTPHGSFPYLYVRTNSTDGEVMSTLIGFDDVNVPGSQVIYGAELEVYFVGQSVNGGATTVHVAGVKPGWDAAIATWIEAQSGSNWQIPGAKGANDRTDPVDSLYVDYTDVGTWLEFDVTDLVQMGYTSFILYGEHEGVNKAIYFPSDEYWDASKHPKLTIRHD